MAAGWSSEEGGMEMNYQFGNRRTLFSGIFSETLWETLVMLGVAGAICVSLIGVSAHLSQARALSPSVAHSTAQAALYQHRISKARYAVR
jgi:ABC-type arginine transport system ATPase subunit